MIAHDEPATRWAELTALRARYPAFRIWQEITGQRARYVARRCEPGSGLHTLVTPDVGELSAVLAAAHAAVPAGRSG